MAGLRRILPNNLDTLPRVALGAACAAMVAASASNAFADDIMVTKAPPIPYTGNGGGYNWNGFYAGANLGVAWGQSNWSAAGAPTTTGTNILYQSIDTFSESGSFYVGVQAGYNYLLPNRVLLGAEADLSAPSFTSPTSGLSVGGSSPNFNSAALGAVNFSETQLLTGSIRGRVGYAPGNWLFYATGGFATTYNQQSLTQVATGNSDSPFIWRFGWTAGGGVETPVAPHWTARIEYLFTDYGNKSWPFFGGAQPLTSNFEVQEVRAGLNYQFNNGAAAPSMPLLTKAPGAPSPDMLDIHGQTTFVYQGSLAFRAPIGSTGQNSLQPAANARETFDTTLFVGIKPWAGGEIWVDPEIDQGHGLADTHGVAGFPSGESYKAGADYPYGRVNRYFLRQTVDLGGDKVKIEDDANQFEQTVTSNRLVLTVGKFGIVDIFDTNKYANSPKNDFLNWALINAGTFDYAGDAWGFTYGGAAEWYQGIFTFRTGVFDMSATPAMAANSVTAYGLDETFSQQQFVGEIEERHEIFGQPGKFKVTAFVTHGRMGSFANAVAAANNPADPNFGNASGAIAADRIYRWKPGVSGNLEQQVNDWIGVFARAGWSDGRYENWDFTDIDRTVQAGVSINGKQWGRANDTVGVAGILNGIQSVHQAYFAAGGTGVLIGDGSLPSYGLEQIVETYYSYAITEATKVSVDYQFIANPGYNATRGPVNVFAGRFHTQF